MTASCTWRSPLTVFQNPKYLQSYLFSFFVFDSLQDVLCLSSQRCSFNWDRYSGVMELIVVASCLALLSLVFRKFFFQYLPIMVPTISIPCWKETFSSSKTTGFSHRIMCFKNTFLVCQALNILLKKFWNGHTVVLNRDKLGREIFSAQFLSEDTASRKGTVPGLEFKTCFELGQRNVSRDHRKKSHGCTQKCGSI